MNDEARRQQQCTNEARGSYVLGPSKEAATMQNEAKGSSIEG